MKVFSAPASVFFDSRVVAQFPRFLKAVRAVEARLGCSDVVSAAEDGRILAHRFEIYKGAVDKYLNCGFFHSAFFPIFVQPLDMARFPWDFRAVFWGEVVPNVSTGTQRCLGTSTDIPDAFLYPIETSYVVLDLMARALVTCTNALGGSGCGSEAPKVGRLAALREQLKDLLDDRL
ncbi:hypothetical protein L0F63_004757 [Massospora cicadina]|nr:hypothetical protein L0F63_004757 [Massospora cicadina]